MQIHIEKHKHKRLPHVLCRTCQAETGGRSKSPSIFRLSCFRTTCVDIISLSSAAFQISYQPSRPTSDPAAPPHFSRSHRSSTLDFRFLSHYSYIKAIMLYKGNHWTRCAGFMDASRVRLGINNDDLGSSWALPGDNLGMIWG